MGDEKPSHEEDTELIPRRKSESAGQSSLSYASEVPHVIPSARHLDVDAPPVILDRHLENEQRAKSGDLPVHDDTLRQGLDIPLSDDDVTDELPLSKDDLTVPSQSRLLAQAASQGPATRPMPAAGRPARPKAPFMTTIIVRARKASPLEKSLAFFLTLIILASLGAALFFWLDKRRLEQAEPPARVGLGD